MNRSRHVPQLAVRLYRLLLLAYPSGFRQEFGAGNGASVPRELS